MTNEGAYIAVCESVSAAGRLIGALGKMAAVTRRTSYLFLARDQAKETADLLTRIIERAEAEAAEEKAVEE